MEIRASGEDRGLELRGWKAQPCTIGKRSYSGSSFLVQVIKVTYQQRSTTYGQTSGMFGRIYDGHGYVGGGAGYVDTRHEGLVTTVLRDADGGQHKIDLPDDLALLEDNVVRIDLVNKQIVRATNCTGRQCVRMMGPSDFIAVPYVSDNLAYIGVIGGAIGGLTLWHWTAAVAAVGLQPALAATVIGLLAPIPLILKRRSIRLAREQRKELAGYIEQVCG
ncbi:MAG: hypothetical protein EOP89_02890 [Lysobacteraceae bacterium]|nr:MAG: hypothetical protein EOP89_02890 [Xanthomonadaceae bacterium]